MLGSLSGWGDILTECYTSSGWYCIYIYYIPPPLPVRFPMTRSVRYQPILNGLKFTLHRARVLNNVVITTVIEMVEKVEILDG